MDQRTKNVSHEGNVLIQREKRFWKFWLLSLNAPALAVRADIPLRNCPPDTKLKTITDLSTDKSARLTASACYAKCIFIFCRAVHRVRNYLSVITNLSV